MNHKCIFLSVFIFTCLILYCYNAEAKTFSKKNPSHNSKLAQQHLKDIKSVLKVRLRGQLPKTQSKPKAKENDNQAMDSEKENDDNQEINQEEQDKEPDNERDESPEAEEDEENEERGISNGQTTSDDDDMNDESKERKDETVKKHVIGLKEKQTANETHKKHSEKPKKYKNKTSKQTKKNDSRKNKTQHKQKKPAKKHSGIITLKKIVKKVTKETKSNDSKKKKKPKTAHKKTLKKESDKKGGRMSLRRLLDSSIEHLAKAGRAIQVILDLTAKTHSCVAPCSNFCAPACTISCCSSSYGTSNYPYTYDQYPYTPSSNSEFYSGQSYGRQTLGSPQSPAQPCPQQCSTQLSQSLCPQQCPPSCCASQQQSFQQQFYNPGPIASLTLPAQPSTPTQKPSMKSGCPGSCPSHCAPSDCQASCCSAQSYLSSLPVPVAMQPMIMQAPGQVPQQCSPACLVSSPGGCSNNPQCPPPCCRGRK